MSTTVKYKGNTLTTVSNATKTLKTAGKYMEGDVILTDEVKLQSKTVVPTSSQQIIIPDNWTSLISKTDTTTKTVNITTSGSTIQYEWSNITPKNDTKYTGIITFGNQSYGYFTFIVSDIDFSKESLVSKRFDNYPLSGVSVIESLLVTYGTGYVKLKFYGASGSGGTINWNEAWIRLYEQSQYDGLVEVIVEPASSSSPTIKSLDITPSESVQTFNSSSVDGYKPVSVSAISSTYIGSGITRRYSNDLTASDATITVPAGYYAEAASKSVATMTLPTSAGTSSEGTQRAQISRHSGTRYINIPVGYNATSQYYVLEGTPNGSVTAPSSISGTAATVSTGTNTLTLTKTISVTPNVTTAGYISSGTAGNSSVSLTASVTTKAAATITPTTTNQTIAAGTYLTGAQTIAGDADLVASNIISTANIFGVQGNVVVQSYYTGSSAPASSLGQNGDIYLQE